tara:strand:+ start:653 stop:877 length:225 start_codon:yes stop_codon:yes gene_type:complete
MVHEIVFHGNGGYTWNEVYNMPIWLRRFTFEKIKAHFRKQNELNEEAHKKAKNKSRNIARPNIKPTYTSKGPSK